MRKIMIAKKRMLGILGLFSIVSAGSCGLGNAKGTCVRKDYLINQSSGAEKAVHELLQDMKKLPGPMWSQETSVFDTQSIMTALQQKYDKEKTKKNDYLICKLYQDGRCKSSGVGVYIAADPYRNGTQARTIGMGVVHMFERELPEKRVQIQYTVELGCMDLGQPTVMVPIDK